MSFQTYQWVLAAHLLGMVLWIGSLSSVYWLLRIHSHAPKDVTEQLNLMERTLAMTMDLAATVTIGCGLVIGITGVPGRGFSWFKVVPDVNGPWLHIKLVFVVALLAVHGMLRVKIKKFGQNKITPVPQWQWTLVLGCVTAAILLAVTKLH